MTRDPVCGKFVADPEGFLQKASAQTRVPAKPMNANLVSQAVALPIVSGVSLAKDPVCGMSVNAAKAAGAVEHCGAKYYFCSAGCAQRFVTEPDRYLAAP